MTDERFAYAIQRLEEVIKECNRFAGAALVIGTDSAFWYAQAEVCHAAIAKLREPEKIARDLAAALPLFRRPDENCFCDRYYDTSCGHQEKCEVARRVLAKYKTREETPCKP